ncbi:hypothetical protein AB9E28_35080, partial [Rhizobium leguminosarum]
PSSRIAAFGTVALMAKRPSGRGGLTLTTPKWHASRRNGVAWLVRLLQASLAADVGPRKVGD